MTGRVAIAGLVTWLGLALLFALVSERTSEPEGEVWVRLAFYVALLGIIGLIAGAFIALWDWAVP